MTRATEPRVLVLDIPGELDRRRRRGVPLKRPNYSEKHVRAGMEIQVQPQTPSERILSRFGLTKEDVAASIRRARR
jgi:hypothetical protein